MLNAFKGVDVSKLSDEELLTRFFQHKSDSLINHFRPPKYNDKDRENIRKNRCIDEGRDIMKMLKEEKRK